MDDTTPKQLDQDPTVPVDKPAIKPPKLTPTAPIDMEGNEELETTRKEKQPMDWTKVKFPRKKREQRPNLTETMNEKVTEELNKHVEDNYRGTNKLKTKPQREMTEDQRLKIIQNMLQKSGLFVGIGPISKEHIDRVEKILINKGVLTKSEKPDIRKQRTIKSLVKSWTRKNLLMTEEDWDNIEVENIIQSENSDIMFVQCRTQEDAARMTSKAKNLPRESGPNTPRIMMYVDKRARKCHKALLNIAKTMREHSKNTLQTSLRMGKNDFLLRKRTKGDETPWTEIPPVLIQQKIPDFEVGIYTDMINLENNIIEDKLVDQMDEDDPEIEEIAKDLEKTLNTKRNRTTEDNSMEKKLPYKKGKIYSEGSSPEQSDNEENDETDRTRSRLNSTPIELEENQLNNKIPSQPRTLEHPSNKFQLIEHYFSVQETPQLRIQPSGRIKFQTIPETPELPRINAKNDTREKRDQSKDEDDLIKELVGDNKNKQTDNE